jgi:hypothetical protein
MAECCNIKENIEYLGPGLSGADYYRCTVCGTIFRNANCDNCKLIPDTFDSACEKCEVIK